MIIFSRVFVNLTCFPSRAENAWGLGWCFYFKSWTLQGMSRMTKHVSKAGKVHPGDRVSLPLKFA